MDPSGVSRYIISLLCLNVNIEKIDLVNSAGLSNLTKKDIERLRSARFKAKIPHKICSDQFKKSSKVGLLWKV